MALAQQVGVELVHVAALLAADVALPGVRFAVAALVQEIQRGVRECYSAKRTYERGRQHGGVAVCWRDHAALGRRGSRSLQQKQKHSSGTSRHVWENNVYSLVQLQKVKWILNDWTRHKRTLEPRARPRAEMRRRKSSLNKLFSGDTLIRDDRLEDTPRLSPPLVSPSRISLLPDSSWVLGSWNIGK